MALASWVSACRTSSDSRRNRRPRRDLLRPRPGMDGDARSRSSSCTFRGPSHIDIWDPKPDAPSNVRGDFKPIRTKVPGLFLSEVMPQLAQQMDKATLIRSMSYTPVGLFNHTAAIYQIMTGYTPDRVSPSGSLGRRLPTIFPTLAPRYRGCDPGGSHASVCDAARPLQESNVIGKGGTAGFRSRLLIPITFIRPGQGDQFADLTLRKEVSREASGAAKHSSRRSMTPCLRWRRR